VILHFAGSHRHVVPAIVSPQRRQHGQSKAGFGYCAGVSRVCQIGHCKRIREKHHADYQRQHHAYLQAGQNRVDESAETYLQTIEAGEKHNEEKADPAYPANTIKRNCALQKSGAAHGVGRNTAGRRNGKTHPAVQKGRQFAVGLAQIDVFTACLREQRADLCIGQGTSK